MPSATQQAVPPSGETAASGGGLFPKKRSHDDYVSGPTLDHSRTDGRISSAASTRPILPLEKRARVDEDRCRTSPTRSSSQHERVLLSTRAMTNEPISTATTTTTTTKTPPSSSLTTPCHVCQRRPRRKCDLDSFSDCEGCGERTCFVCLRECLGPWEQQQQQQQQRLLNTGEGQDVYDGCGYDRAAGGDTPSDGSMTPNDEERSRRWHRDDETTPLAAAAAAPADGGVSRDGHDHHNHPQQQPWGSIPQTRGHRQKICSQCCVERGADGAVVCLGCLAHAGSG